MEKNSKEIQAPFTISWILVMFLAPWIISGSASDSGIYICSESVPQSLYVMENSPAKLCCSIYEYFCKRNQSISLKDTLMLLPSQIYESSFNEGSETGFLGENKSKPFQMRRVDACNVELLLENPLDLELVCVFNTLVVDRRHLKVTPHPDVKVRDIVVGAEKSITLVFDRGSRWRDFNDDYKVTMIEHTRPDVNREEVVLCSKENRASSGIVCPQGKGYCECLYQEKSARYKRVRDIDVTFIITVKRQRVTAEVKHTVNLVDHFLPEATSTPDFEEDSPSQVTTRFCLKERTRAVSSFMEIHGAPLLCHIALNKAEGAIEDLTMELTTSPIKPCVEVTFPNLAPFTTYSLTTSLLGGGGKGPSVVTEFTTGKTVPLRPPVWEDFSFSRRLQPYTLMLLWQPLSHDDQGGGSVTYDLEVWSAGNLEVNASEIPNTFWRTTEPLPSRHLFVKLWARNKIGRSMNFSSLEIPPVSDLKSVPFQVEFSADKVSVHLQSDVEGDFKQTTLHLCKSYGREGDLDTCTTYPQTIFLSAEDSVQHVSGLSIFYTLYLNKSCRKTNTTRRQKSIMYRLYDTVRGSEVMSGPKATTAQAVETRVEDKPCWTDLEPEVISDTEDDERAAYTSGDGIVNEKYEESEVQAKLTKRSAILDSLRASSTSIETHSFEERMLLDERDDPDDGTLQSGRHLLAWSETDVDLVIDRQANENFSLSTTAPEVITGQEEESREFYRVLVSTQAKDGTWLGLTAAECYFDEESDNVEVTISQVQSSGERGFHLIRWIQKCNHRPQQFLVKTYKVLVSNDESCKQNVSLVGEVENRLFEPLTMQVPLGWPFVCVRAYKSSSEEFSVPSVKAIVVPGESNKSTSATTGVVSGLTASAFVVVLVIIFCSCYCKRHCSEVDAKVNHIQNLLDTETNKELKDGAATSGAAGLHEQQKWVSDISGLARTENSDSGMGTLYLQGSNGSSHKSEFKQASYLIQAAADAPQEPPQEHKFLDINSATTETSMSSSVDHMDEHGKVWVIDDSNASSWLSAATQSTGRGSSGPLEVRGNQNEWSSDMTSDGSHCRDGSGTGAMGKRTANHLDNSEPFSGCSSSASYDVEILSETDSSCSDSSGSDSSTQVTNDELELLDEQRSVAEVSEDSSTVDRDCIELMIQPNNQGSGGRRFHTTVSEHPC